ncbi:Mth938-like domain-containing protein [Methylocystis echinoides]|uniref:Membrane protein n=1 Tax=Methylocystis echinoides TaxID=29468 RepID=A0A9W6GVL5_9HYPH|nr:MTH938/NDUFAF3 family protein [Methylocystis echinoides]GLI93882.1 membrane protein [Methylocystis echinoides]
MTALQGYVPGRHKVEDYGNGGFRFADMSHRGSIMAMPTGVRAIAPAAWNEIDAATIEQALAESGELDLFLVGTGKDLMPLAAPLRARLRDAGVGCETMSTGAAVRTYNMLLDEGRRVAALLIAV